MNNIDNKTSLENELHKFNLNLGEKIINLIKFLDHIVIISETKVLLFDMEKSPNSDNFKIIFDSMTDLNTSKKIKYAKFSKKHTKFYLIFQENNETIITRFGIKDQKIHDKFVFKRKLQSINFFKIHKKNKNILFILSERQIFEIDISQSEQSENKNICIFKAESGKINFFKFDLHMKHFYLNNDNNIQRFIYQSKSLQLTYIAHQSIILDLVFTQNYQFMISVDKNDFIIWKIENSLIVSHISYKSLFDNVQSISNIKLRNHLILQDDQGISFFIINKSLPELSSPDLPYDLSPIRLSNDRKYLYMFHGQKYLIRFNLQNDLIFEKVYKINSFVKNIQLLEQGNLLIYESNNKDSHKIIFVNFEHIKYVDKTLNNFYKMRNYEISKEDKNKFLNDKNFDINEFDGRYILYEGKSEILNYQIIFKDDYHESIFPNQNKSNYKNTLLVSTIDGQIYKSEFDFLVDQKIKINFFKTSDLLNENKNIADQYATESHNNISTKIVQINNDQRIIDYKLFPHLNIEIIVIISEKIENSLTAQINPSTVQIKIIDKTSQKLISESEKSKLVKDRNYYNTKMNIVYMNTVGNTHRFYLEHPEQITIVEFNTSKNSVKLKKCLDLDSPMKSEVKYFMASDLLLIPQGYSIQIWNSSLTLLVYTFDFYKDVVRFDIWKTNNSDLLIVYDMMHYYEINLNTLCQTDMCSIPIDSKIHKYILPVNLEYLPSNCQFILPSCHLNLNKIHFFESVELLESLKFPSESFLKGCRKTNYQFHVKEYAKYYFDKLKKLNYKDDVYGPLSPLYLAIHHNDEKLLEDVMNMGRYPREVVNYWSPLQFALKMNYYLVIKVLCEKLSKRDYFVEFSIIDFQELLTSKYSFCHQLIVTIPYKPLFKNFPNLMVMENNVTITYTSELIGIIADLKNKEKLINADLKLQKKSPPTEVEISQVSFKYNYQFASPDSVKFLKYYSQSNCEAFVISKWKEVINDKWVRQRPLHVLLSSIFWLFTITNSISIIFMPDVDSLRIFCIVFIFLLLFFEIIEMISYSSFGAFRYFKDFWNYIDILCYIMLIVYHFVLYSKNSDFSQIWVSISLLLLYYRSFLYLRVIDAFTTLIGMVNTIVVKLIVFFVIIFYLYFGIVLVMIKLSDRKSISESFESAYFWLLFGGVGGEDFTEDSPIKFPAIPIIFGTLMITIVLLNILIAYLSNLFSKLEEQQHVDDLREKASMILDLEIIVYFFKYRLTGKRNKYIKYNKLVKDKLTDFNSKTIIERVILTRTKILTNLNKNSKKF